MHFVINGKAANLFPLAHINDRLKGYFMDAGAGIYSTKMGAMPRKMYGSGPTYNKSFTLSNTSYNGAQLFRQAKANRLWALETTGEKVAVEATHITPATQAIKDRAHAKTTRDGLAAKGWVIARVLNVNGVGETLVLGSKPAVHTTKESYKAEMERLAAQHPGVTFVGLKVDATVVSGGVTWG